jgi:diguanylate cyclase (GGDEF)-like protein
VLSDNKTLIPENEDIRLLAVQSLLPSQAQTSYELDALMALGRKVFNVALAAVTIIDDDWQYIAARNGLPMDGCSRDKSMCTRVVYSGEPFVVSDLAANEDFRALPYVVGAPHFRFYAGTPLELETGITVGAMCLLDHLPRSLSEEELSTLNNFGAVASGLLRLQRSNIILRRDETVLKTAAMTDPLTGFLNRTALSSIVDGMVAAAVAENRDVGAIYMDLDGFKKINDRHGHPVGDDDLVEAARRIRTVIRANDLPVRLGGDEFAIFFSGPCDLLDMEAIAARLIGAFREPFDVDGVKVDARASLGVAMAPRHARTRLELSRNADIALYEAKGRGRDQYVIFQREN